MNAAGYTFTARNKIVQHEESRKRFPTCLVFDFTCRECGISQLAPSGGFVNVILKFGLQLQHKALFKVKSLQRNTLVQVFINPTATCQLANVNDRKVTI